MEDVGIYYDHLEYFTAILYNFRLKLFVILSNYIEFFDGRYM
jgi:hypothetical protein